MSTLTRSLPLVAAVLCFGGAMADAGLFNRFASCGDNCAVECAANSSCPADYCCTCESETVDLKRHCFETKCEPVVVPGITLPCCKCRLKRLFHRRNGCDFNGQYCGCGDGECGNGCGCGSEGGVIGRLCSKLTCCKVRCVNTYEKKEYKCGTKRVCSWSAESRYACGDDGCVEGASCTPQCCTPTGCSQ